MTFISGAVRKMRATLSDPVLYQWVAGEQTVELNQYLGQSLSINFLGTIHCVHCHRLTKKSFNQGYCYPCFRDLAQCDTCIMKPEKCHFAEGTCREPEWGEANCNIEHYVYLSHTSSVKVGITRGTQIPTRWIDQGATQARAIARVATRYQSGLIEVLLGQHIGDKTAWQTMLKGNGEPLDLAAKQAELAELCAEGLASLQQQFGLNAIHWIEEGEDIAINFPVLEWPAKIKSHNLDKTPEISGTLLGIKGQYLMLDTGVINIRKYGGYNLELKVKG